MSDQQLLSADMSVRTCVDTLVDSRRLLAIGCTFAYTVPMKNAKRVLTVMAATIAFIGGSTTAALASDDRSGGSLGCGLSYVITLSSTINGGGPTPSRGHTTRWNGVDNIKSHSGIGAWTSYHTQRATFWDISTNGTIANYSHGCG